MENDIETKNMNTETVSETVATPEIAPAPAKKPFPIWIIAVIVAAFALAAVLVVLLIPKNADYTFTVIDEIGNPVSNVMIKFTDGSGETKTRITDKDGNVKFTECKVGKENTVKVLKGMSEVTILTEEYKLDKKTTSLRIIVRDDTNTNDIYGEIPDNSYSYGISTGSYNIPANENIVYLTFMASISGTYNISIVTTDEASTVAYVGMPMYVQTNHRGDGEYDGKSFNLVIQDVNTPYVFAVKANNGIDAKLTVERTGDAPFDPNYAPWDEVKAPANVTKCDTTGITLNDFDLADTTISLTLGNDGFYYTSTGKRVYVRIDSDIKYGNIVDGKFVPAVGSLAFLAGYVDQNVGMNVGGYIYDENGNFVSKKSYNDMIGTYMEYVDDTYGVVQLTKDLAECIQLHGESNGWWTTDSVNSMIFDGISVQPQNAWLIYCMVEA